MDTEKVDALSAELERIHAQLQEALTPVFNQLINLFGQLAANLRENVAMFSEAWRQNPAWEFVLAYAWACGARPKWVRILNRTKKDRTRKKYQDRILQAYRNRDDMKGR